MNITVVLHGGLLYTSLCSHLRYARNWLGLLFVCPLINCFQSSGISGFPNIAKNVNALMSSSLQGEEEWKSTDCMFKYCMKSISKHELNP